MSVSGFFKKGVPALIAVAVLVMFVWVYSAKRLPGEIPPTKPDDSATLSYPLALYEDDPLLVFPAAEGVHLDMDSDTWFLEGVLEGKESGHQYGFIVVFFSSRIFGLFPLDFYSLAFYDLENGDYGTYSSFSRVHAANGYLNLSTAFEDTDTWWKTKLDENGYLVPFHYEVDLLGTDHTGRDMRLISEVIATNPPVPVGADTFKGIIEIFQQPGTYSYYQTGIEFDGRLTWGEIDEPVTGHIGHIDRQIFPKFVGVNSGLDGRKFSHEWRTYFFDNGVDFSSWRIFDRTNFNEVVSYNGATVYEKGVGSRYAADIEYEVLTYRRVENHPVKPLAPPRAGVLYFADKHRLVSETLNLRLETIPLSQQTPMLAFPVEYVHGPVRLKGEMNGEPFTGIGSFERTFAMYRDFELARVLLDSLKGLPESAFASGAGDRGRLIDQAVELEKAIIDKQRDKAEQLIAKELDVSVEKLAQPYKQTIQQILVDINNSL